MGLGLNTGLKVLSSYGAEKTTAELIDEVGLSLNSLDRALTNEIKLLKQSITKDFFSSATKMQNLLDFTGLKQSGTRWKQYLVNKVSDCKIVKFSLCAPQVPLTKA